MLSSVERFWTLSLVTWSGHIEISFRFLCHFSFSRYLSTHCIFDSGYFQQQLDKIAELPLLGPELVKKWIKSTFYAINQISFVWCAVCCYNGLDSVIVMEVLRLNKCLPKVLLAIRASKLQQILLGIACSVLLVQH